MADEVAVAPIFVAIVSPAYAASSHCEREVKRFEEEFSRSQSGLRHSLIRVDKLPIVGPSFVDQIDALTSTTNRFEFYDASGSPRELGPLDERFQIEVGRVAQTIVALLPAPSRAAPAKPDDGLPRLEADVSALLADAVAVGTGRSEINADVTTRTLMFALAESGGESAPALLRSANAAIAFRQALLELAKSSYQTVWQDYFRPGFTYASRPAPSAKRPSFSENVNRLLRSAEGEALKRGGRIGIADLVDALFRTGGRFLATLEKMSVEPEALEKLYREKLAASPADEAAFRVRLAGNITSDTISKQDHLEFERYARAIEAFIMSRETSGPISISIQAPWGGGKSTLMSLVRERLKLQNQAATGMGGVKRSGPRMRIKSVLDRVLSPDTKVRPQSTSLLPFWQKAIASEPEPIECVTVWFNAWKYESANQLWAGLVDAIIREVAESRPNLFTREQFYLELNRHRISADKVRKVIAERAWTIWWRGVGAFSTAVAGAGATVIASFWKANDPHVPLVTLVAGGLSAIVGVFGITRVGAESKARGEEAAATHIADLVDVPDYGKEAGFVHSVEADLRILLQMSGSKRLVVFVDDLDRCSPSSVSQVMSGLNLFLAGDFPQCYFVIGMDAEMVAASLEFAHRDVVKKLPADARVPVGWRFMDKFITLPFVIPPSGTSALMSYMDTLYGKAETARTWDSVTNVGPAQPEGSDFQVDSGGTASPFGPAKDNIPPRPATPEPVIFKESDERVQVAVRSAIRYIGSNPRDLKRFVNALRLNCYVCQMPTETGISPYDLVFPQIVAWTILSIRWPEVARWIRRGSAPRAATGNRSANATERLELLAGISADCATISLWKDRAKEQGLDDKELRWLGDGDLLALLRADAGAKHRTLVAGVGKGLW